MEDSNSKNVQKRPYKAYIGGFRLYNYIGGFRPDFRKCRKTGF